MRREVEKVTFQSLRLSKSVAEKRDGRKLHKNVKKVHDNCQKVLSRDGRKLHQNVVS
jgi:hypothetical protein